MMTDNAEPNSDEKETAMVLAPPPDMRLVQDPKESLDDAARAARALTEMVEAQGLARSFQKGGKKHLYAEAWQTIAAWYGVTYGIDRIEDITEEVIGGTTVIGFRAYAYAETPNGRRFQAASACRRDEQNWSNKPAFQLESMAQTRAMSKVLRSALGFVPVLAGYSATPADEMIPEREAKPAAPSRARPPAETIDVPDDSPLATPEEDRTEPERVPAMATKGAVLQYGLDHYGWDSAKVLEVLGLSTVTDIEPGPLTIERMDAYAADSGADGSEA